LTKENSKYHLSRTSGALISALILISSCGSQPREGEIVIRWDDVRGDSTDTVCSQTNVQSPVETVPPDTFSTAGAEIDSIVLAEDSLAFDTLSVATADTQSCPWTRLALEINGSIYGSLRGLADDPDVLGAHIVRCMVWDTDPWHGMNAGDSIYVLVGETGRENSVVALRYVPKGGTSNHEFSVYSFTMTGDNFPSFYYSDGTEMMKLLNYMPVNTFEEMTSPYGEPRGDHVHSGVDFKAPEGTPVRTCRGGTVTRVNWNHDYNGNCVEISIGGGYKEIFLHLESVAPGISPGVVISRGDRVGSVGNTGETSTAPHVHYQINDENGNPIDPYLFYSSHRRHLPQEDMERFQLFRDRCDEWLRASTGNP
jgi:hypothetical protein